MLTNRANTRKNGGETLSMLKSEQARLRRMIRKEKRIQQIRDNNAALRRELNDLRQENGA